MSRKSKAEYIAERRRAYAKAKRDKRSQIISEVFETVDLSRKYAIKLLTGNLEYRKRKGRGKTYSAEVLNMAREIWEAVGCPCTTYFVAEMPRIVREYEACTALIKPQPVKDALLKLSPSTLDRGFRKLPRHKLGFTKANRRAGMNRPILDAIECKSGELVMASLVKPGDTQIDTVAHCGGDMRDNFFWTLTMTDRNTQWTEITPTWNRGMHNTVEALKRLERRIPFPITSEHMDNGPEFINYAMAEMQGKRKGIALSRSRFYRKNDNAHVEQKNRSVVRELFGEMRLDCKEQEDDLIRLERMWSDYCNFFRPTKMLVAKTKKADGKGFRRVYEAGGPRTPYQRVIDSGVLDEDGLAKLRKRREELNGVELYRQIKHLAGMIQNRQKTIKANRREMEETVLAARNADSSLRDDSAYPVCQNGAVDLRPSRPGIKKRHRQSVEKLTNQKTKRLTSGALST